MKISGTEVADAISEKLHQEVSRLSVKPTLAIVLAGDDPSSRIYVSNKLKRAADIGIQVRLLEFGKDQYFQALKTIRNLNQNPKVSGIIIQYPVYRQWDFEELMSNIDPKKDVDGFLNDSPFKGATALAVWEMLTAFAYQEGFQAAEEFLKGKQVVLLGKGRTAGGPTRDLLKEKNIPFVLIDSKTKEPEKLIKNADVVISATGRKNIITGDKVKNDSYVIGVGVGKEMIEGQQKIYGDIEESTVARQARMYCPTIGGIGPLTIVSLLSNVIKSAKGLTD